MEKIAELSPNAKHVLTSLLVGLALNAGAGAASSAEIKKIIGEQNIDTDLADRLAREFIATHKLKDVKIDRSGPSDGGPHFKSVAGRVGGVVIGGPVGAKGRDAAHPSLDDPAIMLHELGHAKARADGALSAKINEFSRVIGAGSFLLYLIGETSAAAAVAAIGSIARLREERLASQHAIAFLRQNLSKEDADAAERLLGRAFRSHAYGAAADVVSPIAAGFIRRAFNV